MSLSRNLAAYPFGRNLSPEHQLEVRRAVEKTLIPLSDEFISIDSDTLRPELVQFFQDRGLLDAETPRAVSYVTGDETTQLSIGGDDHVRVVTRAGGWDFESSLERAREIDQMLEEELSFAVSLRLGYLTADIDAVGTGISFTGLVFLPTLLQGSGIDAIAAEAGERISLQPFQMGEERHPALYEVQCRARFSEPEEDTRALLEGTIRRLVHYEREARNRILTDHRIEFSDAVHRALGAMIHARTVSAEEATEHATLIRLGAVCGLLDTLTSVHATELLFLVGDYAVDLLGTSDDEKRDPQDTRVTRDTRDIKRAALIRDFLTVLRTH